MKLPKFLVLWRGCNNWQNNEYQIVYKVRLIYKVILIILLTHNMTVATSDFTEVTVATSDFTKVKFKTWYE